MKKRYTLLMLVVGMLRATAAEACTIYSCSPGGNLCAPASVTIIGSFAATGSYSPSVSIGGASCTIGSYSEFSITVNVPSSASGTFVSVRDRSGSSCSGAYPGLISSTPPSIGSITAAPPIINSGESTTLIAGSGTAFTNWFKGTCNSGSIGTGISIIVNPTVTTTYCARNEDLYGICFSSCACVTVTVMPSVGISENTTQPDAFTVYPDPASSAINLSSSGALNEITIYDISGRKMRKLWLSDIRTASVDISSLDRGIYIVEASVSGRMEIRRFIKL